MSKLSSMYAGAVLTGIAAGGLLGTTGAMISNMLDVKEKVNQLPEKINEKLEKINEDLQTNAISRQPDIVKSLEPLEINIEEKAFKAPSFSF